MTDLVSNVIDYESGELDHDDTVAMFQGLIDSGQAWKLQGSYGRTAMDLIQGGYCTLGPEAHTDYYGNIVPGVDDIEPGTPGSREFVEARED